MKSRATRWPTVFIALVLGITLPGLSYGQVSMEKSEKPGLFKYMPTRIEWLALELQSYYGSTNFGTERYRVTYVAGGADTITISVHYLPGVDREQMNKAVESARRIIGATTRSHGWNWVKVKETYEKLE